MDLAHDIADGYGSMRAALSRGMAAMLLAPVALMCWDVPVSAQHGEDAFNARLVGMNNLQARSAYHGVIENQDGRYILYVGHHGGVAFNPLSGMVEENGVSILDVTNARRPVYLYHLPPIDTSSSQMVQVCSGDELPAGEPGAYYLLRTNGNEGHNIYDVTDPSNPEFVATVTSGLSGTHKNWWECETGIAYLVADLRPDGWTTNRGLKVFDLSDPSNPVFIRNFGMVGSEPGATEPPVRSAAIHEPTRLGDRVYLAYGTGSEGALQIVDREALLTGDPDPTPENLLAPVVSQLNMPDYWGGHTAWAMTDMVLPEYELFEEGSPRDFVVLTTESTANSCQEPTEHMNWFVDITDEAHPFPVSNYQVAESEGLFCDVGGRFGAHSQNWSYTDVFYKKIVAFSYFNAGARMVDVRDPYRPKEVAHYIPATTADTDERCAEIDGIEECFIAIQTNNVEVDDRGYIYLYDRANTGVHIVELAGEARQIIDEPAEEAPAEDEAMVAEAP